MNSSKRNAWFFIIALSMTGALQIYTLVTITETLAGSHYIASESSELYEILGVFLLLSILAIVFTLIMLAVFVRTLKRKPPSS